MNQANDPVLDHLTRVQADQAPAKPRVDSYIAQPITPSDQLTHWLALGGVIGPILFVAAFIVGGVLRPTLSRTWCWVCAVLLACTGLGFADAGIFTEAPATVALHWMIGMPLLALGSVVGFLLTGLALRQDTQWRRWSIYSLVAGISTLALIAVMFWVWTPGTPLASLKPGGLVERVLFIEILAWYVALGWRLFRGAPSLASKSS
jgi:hypothetical protein